MYYHINDNVVDDLPMNWIKKTILFGQIVYFHPMTRQSQSEKLLILINYIHAICTFTFYRNRHPIGVVI